jgi:hypothetical protein
MAASQQTEGFQNLRERSLLIFVGNLRNSGNGVFTRFQNSRAKRLKGSALPALNQHGSGAAGKQI